LDLPPFLGGVWSGVLPLSSWSFFWFPKIPGAQRSPPWCTSRPPIPGRVVMVEPYPSAPTGVAPAVGKIWAIEGLVKRSPPPLLSGGPGRVCSLLKRRVVMVGARGVQPPGGKNLTPLPYTLQLWALGNSGLPQAKIFEKKNQEKQKKKTKIRKTPKKSLFHFTISPMPWLF